MICCKRIVDLSQRMYPGKEEYGLELESHNTAELYPQYKVEGDTWYILQTIHMSSHCGTHIEFPYHHNKEGLDAASFPFEKLIGEALVLDFQNKKSREAVTLEEVKVHGSKIKENDMLLFNFGLGRFYGTPRIHDRPYVDPEAVEWLVLEKKIGLIGTDASGIEIQGIPNQPNHEFLMKHQVPMIEFIGDLNQLTSERFTLLVLALPIVGLDSCPVRLVAIEEEGE